MPRKHPEPFWREQTKCWYIQLGGKQHRLDPDRDEAFKLYHEMMSRPERAPVAAGSIRVDELGDSFLEWTKTHQAE